MKISIEYKDRKYTVVYGKLTGIGASVKEAIDDLVKKFRDQISNFFPSAQ